jgi:hypothetical protein
LANAKLTSLSIPADRLLTNARSSLKTAKNMRLELPLESERDNYLKSWFLPEYLTQIERLRLAIQSIGDQSVNVLLSIASNLLRDYSLQEPQDLRIRRRKSPYPEIDFFDSYEKSFNEYCHKLHAAQSTLGITVPLSKAINIDCRHALSQKDLHPGLFDLILTSPPYATALPYIDTQRLSLVWLKLIEPKQIAALEAELIGSREIRGQSKNDILNYLINNIAMLPTSEHEFCVKLENALGDEDGFRRKVVPRLLYRYFSGMGEAFAVIRNLAKPKAFFGLIVGCNHTILGGTRYDIDTPKHLVSIATQRGWKHIETIRLQTYKRYGLHASNATKSEALIILRAR